MEDRRAPRTHYAFSFLFFGLTGIMAIVLLVMALVIWVAAATGSLIAASLIVGGVCALLALITYLASIRDAVANLKDHFETVYEVAQLARTGYEWVTSKLCLLMNLRGK